jgi:EAL domain-containing protein (putative c-di-GMP-specific phosphodiesterase class I)
VCSSDLIREFGRKLALAAAAARAPRASYIPPQSSAPLQPPPPRLAAPPVDPALDAQFAALREFPLSLFVQHLTPLQPGTRIRRYEVLLRSTLPAGADEAPRQMLQAAERQGLGSVIDRRVLNELVVWLMRNGSEWNTSPALFSVNLSTTSLYDEHFLKFVELCLAKSELPRELIAFEVDAQLCRRRPDHSLRLATGLARAGSGIVLDDFSWYDDSLSLLRLPAVRLLKLDRALTADLAADKIRQAAIAGIAQMAKVAGVHTVAKRVDCEAERDLLTALGVDFIQGFPFSAPAPLDAAALASNAAVIVDPSAL